MATLLIILVIGLPWLGAIFISLIGDVHPRTEHLFAAGTTVMSCIASLALLGFATSDTILRLPLGSTFGDLAFVPDGLGCFLAAIASSIGSLTVIFSAGYMRGEKQLGRYYTLVLLFIGAMTGLVLINNLFMLLLFWEIVAFCSYALISFYSDDPKAVAGGIRALIMTQIGGVGLLVGTLITYTSLGSYEISALLNGANKLPANILSVIAFTFLIAAAAKSAQIPFHTWLPGAMEAPTPVSALIHAATMVNAGVYLLARFYPAFAAVPGWTFAVVTIGCLSALLAALLALFATDLKRVLAYSTISQLGYMFYAIGIGAIFASQFHLLSHAIFKALLFLMAGTVIHAVGTRDLHKMGGLGTKLPFIRSIAWVGALALMGIPILNGFWSKELILETGAASDLQLPLILMLAGVFLTTLYTIRMMWLVFYGEPHTVQSIHQRPRIMNIVLVVLAIGTFLTWLISAPLGKLFTTILPYHDLQPMSLFSMVEQIFSTPTTYITWLLILMALLLWQSRSHWLAIAQYFSKPLEWLIRTDFGFEWLNSFLVRLVQYIASKVQSLQTGKLNWNIVGILLGLLAVLLVLGGRP